MALFTTSDRDLVKAALITAATTGFATVSIAGQAVTTYTLDQLRSLLKVIQEEIAADNVSGFVGMRTRKTIPPGAG